MADRRGLPAMVHEWEREHETAFQLAKVFASGGMIGTSILCPMFTVEGHGYVFLVLPIYIVSAAVFYGVFLERVIKYCPYVVAVGLIILFIAVIPGGSSRRELVPWLPLIFTALSFLPVAIDHIVRHVGQGSGNRRFLASDLVRLFSQRPYSSPQMSDEESALTLSHIHPRMGSDWDSQTRAFFLDQEGRPQGSRTRDPSPAPQAATYASSWESRDIEEFSVEPLLGSQA